jgi:hypothetical protein
LADECYPHDTKKPVRKLIARHERFYPAGPTNPEEEPMNIAQMSAAVVVTTLLSGAAFAGECGIEYTRTACPGKEAESYAKCNGKQTCVQAAPLDSAAACQAAALKACANDRLDVTKSKVIRAMFDGKPVKSASGKEDFCADYANRSAEFDKCGK